jgi:hypothetical protein
MAQRPDIEAQPATGREASSPVSHKENTEVDSVSYGFANSINISIKYR